MNSEKFRQNGISNYNEYLDYLINFKVIESDNQFILGKKSRGYRLKPKYRTTLKEVKINGGKNVNAGRYLREIKSRKKYNYLSHYFDMGNLTIDYDHATDFINDKLKKSKRDEIGYEIMKHNTRFYCISMIHHEDYFFFADETGNRIHTNLTILPKELRKFITYNSQPLSAIDIKNSQPYFSTILFKPEFYKKSDEIIIYKILNVKSTYKRVKPITQSILTQAHPTITLLISLGEAERQEVRGYVSTVEFGQLYEQYRDAYNETFNSKISRDEAKEKLFQVMYSQDRHYAKEKEVFNRMFPTVNKVFSIIKEKYHQCLAVLLQRIEAHIVLDKACKKIASEYPQLPLFTIHDSIVTLHGYEQEIKRIVEEELSKYIGIKPTLKYEYWSNSTYKKDENDDK